MRLTSCPSFRFFPPADFFSKRIFDSISHRYDFLNHFLSAGVDVYWRNKAIKLSKMNSDSILLDIACGTGDFAITAKKSGVKNIFGADLSFNMLNLFGKKAGWSQGKTAQCVAENLPYKDYSFTNITVAFGVRNFYNLLEGCEVTVAVWHRDTQACNSEIYNFHHISKQNTWK